MDSKVKVNSHFKFDHCSVWAVIFLITSLEAYGVARFLFSFVRALCSQLK